MRASLPPADAIDAGGSGEGGLAASDGLGSADPPAGHCADSARCFAAQGRLGLTRRAVLGAAVAVPVAAGIGGSDSVRPSPPIAARRAPPLPRKAGEGEWGELLRKFQRIDFAKERFREASSAKAYGPGRRPFDEQEALDKRFGEIVDKADAAMLKLLEAPAPDLLALAEKISLIGDHLVWEMEGGEECMVWLEADARRLAAQKGGIVTP